MTIIIYYYIATLLILYDYILIIILLYYIIILILCINLNLSHVMYNDPWMKYIELNWTELNWYIGFWNSAIFIAPRPEIVLNPGR
jgi:hypothetical protein